MNIMLKLLNESDPFLKKSCPTFDFENPIVNSNQINESVMDYLKNITDEMHDIMIENNGIGLAAPQVNLDLRLFIMYIEDEQIICVNPKIESQSLEFDIDMEGCLSFPELYLRVKRPSSINVSYQHIDGTKLTRTMTGIMARCFQHELDHLNGITFDTVVGDLSLKMAKSKRQKRMKKLSRKGI